MLDVRGLVIVWIAFLHKKLEGQISKERVAALTTDGQVRPTLIESQEQGVVKLKLDYIDRDGKL